MIRSVLRAPKFSVFKIDKNRNFVVSITPSLLASICFGIAYTIKYTLFCQGVLMRVQYPKCAYMVYIVLFNSSLKRYIPLDQRFFLYLSSSKISIRFCMRVYCLKIRNDHNLCKHDAIALTFLYIAIFAVAKGGCCSISDDLSCSCYMWWILLWTGLYHWSCYGYAPSGHLNDVILVISI